MNEKPVIHIYVSYNTVQTETLKQLIAAFEQYNHNSNADYKMEVKYSENSIEENDNIVDFMDEIAVAKFVVMIFSKEYFESPHCWYELISAYETQDLEARSFVLPIKADDKFAYLTIDKLIQAWKGGREQSERTKDKGENYGQEKLRELLNRQDEQIEKDIKTVFNGFIKDKVNQLSPVKSNEEIVQEIKNQAGQVFAAEQEKLDQLIKINITRELNKIKNLRASWKNFSELTNTAELIAKVLMEASYSDALLKIQAWSKKEKKDNICNDWRLYFSRIEKIAGWLILKSINPDWWINNMNNFSGNAKNQAFVKLNFRQNEYSFGEVVVSRALLKPTELALDEANKTMPANKNHQLQEGQDFIFDSSDNATLHSLIYPIVTDINKADPQIQNSNDLFNQLIALVSTNTDNFFYLVPLAYVKKLQQQLAPGYDRQTVLEVINKKLKTKLIFIAIDAEYDETAPQVTSDILHALGLFKNILLIDTNN